MKGIILLGEIPVGKDIEKEPERLGELTIILNACQTLSEGGRERRLGMCTLDSRAAS